MQAWMNTTNWWLQSIEDDFKILLEHDNPENELMYSFRQNSEACADYGVCPYYDFCWAWPNPVKQFDRTPSGFKVDYWNPADREKESSGVFKDGVIIPNVDKQPHVAKKKVEKPSTKGLLFR